MSETAPAYEAVELPRDQQAEYEATITNLRIALESSRQIGTAIGILMVTYKITGDAAFDVLKAVSQRLHRKLRLVAEEVVLTGTLPLHHAMQTTSVRTSHLREDNIETHSRAALLHDDAAATQERLGHPDRAKVARSRAAQARAVEAFKRESQPPPSP